MIDSPLDTYKPSELEADEWKAVLAAYVALLESEKHREYRSGLDRAMHKIRLNLVPEEAITALDKENHTA